MLNRHFCIVVVSFAEQTPAKQIAQFLVLLLLCQRLDAQAGNLLTLSIIDESNSCSDTKHVGLASATHCKLHVTQCGHLN